MGKAARASSQVSIGSSCVNRTTLCETLARLDGAEDAAEKALAVAVDSLAAFLREATDGNE